MKEALVVIDMQEGMFSIPGHKPFDGDGVISRIAGLIECARKSNIPVIYVQHQGEGGHPLSPNREGFSICSKLSPETQEVVFVKDLCNAFPHTKLHEHMQKIGVGRVIVCGMQSEYCVDTFVRAAHERGYELVLVEDGHTTFDTETLNAAEVIRHHNNTLKDAFASVVKAQDVSLEFSL